MPVRSPQFLLPAGSRSYQGGQGRALGASDTTLIMVVPARLRAMELAGLRWDQVECFGRSARLHVRRAEGRAPSVHPIQGDELRMLAALHHEYPESRYVFTTERGKPFTPDAINRSSRTSVRGEAPDAYSHPYATTSRGLRLGGPRRRHSGNSGLVGACRITHATGYTALSSARFKDFSAGLIPNNPAAPS